MMGHVKFIQKQFHNRFIYREARIEILMHYWDLKLLELNKKGKELANERL